MTVESNGIFSTQALVGGGDERLDYMNKAIANFDGKPFIGMIDLHDGKFHARETTLETIKQLEEMNIFFGPFAGLAEKDLDHALALAKQNGVPLYLRAPALGLRDAFITGLADLVENSLKTPCGIYAGTGEGACKVSHKLCPRQNPALVSV